MSLKQKTKKWGCYHCSCCRFYHGFAKGCELPGCAYILVSVAQQEIDKLRNDYEALSLKMVADKLEKERECGLQKQKLHEMAVATSLGHTHPSPEFWKGWNKAIDTVLAVLEGKEKAKPT